MEQNHEREIEAEVEPEAEPNAEAESEFSNLPDLVDIEVENPVTLLTDLAPLEIQCPVCDQMHPIDSLIPHLMMNHPRFFVVWSAYSMPWQTNINDTMDDDEDLFQDYNYLMNLCETIGYHKEGIQDIDQVTEVIAMSDDKRQQPMNDYCPICMEELFTNDPVVRMTHKCHHGFCATCIEKWLSQNKTCPICMQWLPPDDSVPTHPVSNLEDVD